MHSILLLCACYVQFTRLLPKITVFPSKNLIEIHKIGDFEFYVTAYSSIII